MKNSLKNLNGLKHKLLIIVNNSVREEIIYIGKDYKVYIKKYDTILNQRISLSFNMGFKNKNPFTKYNFVSFNLVHRNNDLEAAENNASIFSLAFDEKNRLISKEFLLKQKTRQRAGLLA